MKFNKEFKNMYKKVVVMDDLTRGTAVGFILARMIDRESGNLKLIGTSAVIHLSTSAALTAYFISIGVTEDELDEYSEGY